MNPLFAHRVARVRPSAIRELLTLGNDPDVVSFGGGFPDAALFPTEELSTIFTELLAAGGNSLQYTASEGILRLREQIAARMSAQGTPCQARDLLITNGAQQGLDLVAKLLVDPGDVVVTESPTFLGALLAFNPYEPTYAAVKIDQDGMDPDDLEAVLAAHPSAKFLYTVPDFQNPMGVTMSLERRLRILELARAYNVIVLEDAPYRELRFEGIHLPTLASLDTDGRVIHLGSFSKILAPGFRLGWVFAAPEIIDRLGLLKLAADTQASTLNMAAVSAYLDRYDIDAHVDVIVKAYRAKRDLTVQTLGECLSDRIAFTRPGGGLFTWLTFPEGFDAAAFMKDTLLPKARLAYVPGASFFPVVEQTHNARLSYATLPEQQLVDGLTRLAHHLNEAVADVPLAV